MLTLLLFALSAFLIAALGTWWVSRPGSPFYVLDHPTDRSLHERPIPRTGGVAIVTAMALTLPFAVQRFGGPPGLAWAGVAGALVAAISLADDRHKLKVRYRLPVHLAAGLMLVAAGFWVHRVAFPGVAWSPGVVIGSVLALLVAVWMLNLYNFMDGMDGNAGGMAVIGFGAFAVLAWRAGNPGLAAVAACVAGAGAGFLVFNFPPASVFMGDTGSSTLGFSAAALALWGVRAAVFPVWVPLLVFSPFVVDATVTLVRRVVTGERAWEAHRDHYYQRLVRAGLGHRATVLLEYAVMLSCAASAIVAGSLRPAGQAALLGAWSVFYALAFWRVTRLHAHRNAAPAAATRSRSSTPTPPVESR
jgi:UDP-N-acetylmuramyl pentapeptide phosphotransferase/UDP-N-acetylglucosamine-1-phosphate transferase